LSFFATKTEGKGLGLGLSTVFGIVDRHKGSIEVRSEIGQGAAFIIRVPVGPKDPV
jgi:signal transduction histidine kinase